RRGADAIGPYATFVRSRSLTTVPLHLVEDAADDRSIVSIPVVKGLGPPFVVPVNSNFFARSHHRRCCQQPCTFAIPNIVGVRSSGSVRVFLCFRRFHRPQTRQSFAHTSPLGKSPTCLTCTALEFAPHATESGYVILLGILCAVNCSRPLNVEKNRSFPQSGFFELIDESLEPNLPSKKGFVGAEFDQAGAWTTGVTRRATGFDLQRVRHRRSIGEQPIAPTLVDEVDKNEVEVVSMLDYARDPIAFKVACAHPFLER